MPLLRHWGHVSMRATLEFFLGNFFNIIYVLFLNLALKPTLWNEHVRKTRKLAAPDLRSSQFSAYDGRSMNNRPHFPCHMLSCHTEYLVLYYVGTYLLYQEFLLPTQYKKSLLYPDKIGTPISNKSTVTANIIIVSLYVSYKIGLSIRLNVSQKVNTSI